nr:DUF2442 domain-containing protein [Microcystis aeruginosa]
MLNKPKITVIIEDKESYNFLPESQSVQILSLPNLKNIDSLKNIFICTSLTGLKAVSDIARTANDKHHLRGLFIRADIDSIWLPKLFKRANLRTLRNTLVYRDFTLPTRVINAWIWGAQEHLIATALVIGESLLISRCDFDELEIPFASMPALQRIPLEERENFIIAEDGSYIHWPVVDIHLDIRDFTLPTRVINDWIWGAQEHLIATALVIGESLLISRCDLNELEIPFASMPALQRIPLEEREKFIIAEDGSYIHWPVVDIHLDVEAFLSVIEPVAKQKFAAIKLKHDQIFGQAIASLRKQHQLRQSDIIGVSERQVRRIEQGEGTKVETLNLFAQAHKMELNDYLDAVAQLIDNTSVDLL